MIARSDDAEPLARTLRAVLASAQSAGLDPWYVAAAWAGSALLRCTSGAELGRALGVPAPTARKALALYRGALVAAGMAEDLGARLDAHASAPPGALPPERECSPRSETRGGEGGGLPAGSLPLPKGERDPEILKGGARSARALTEEASRAARPAGPRVACTIPHEAESAAANHLERLGYSKEDRRRGLWWVRLQWSEGWGSRVASPKAWACSVAERRLIDLGCRPLTDRQRADEAAAWLLAGAGRAPSTPPAGGSGAAVHSGA